MGDIHGCIDLLEALIEAIRGMQTASQPPRLVFLGDYVDRGPESRRVLDVLAALPDDDTVFLRGNHDHMMLEFLRRPDAGPAWKAIGGDTTLTSYGVKSPAVPDSKSGWEDTWARFNSAVPETHRQFLQSSRFATECGDYFFAHAGVRPGRALGRQHESDLMWIRNAFLLDTRSMEKVIVHGHTPAALPFSDHRRVGVDTGAYASGTLTAVRLQGEDRRFLQVRRTPESTIVPVWDVPPASVA